MTPIAVVLITSITTLIVSFVGTAAAVLNTILVRRSSREAAEQNWVSKQLEEFRSRIETSLSYALSDDQFRQEIGLMQLRAARDSIYAMPEDSSRAAASMRVVLARGLTLRADELSRFAVNVESLQINPEGIDDPQIVEASRRHSRTTIENMRRTEATLREAAARILRGEGELT